MTMPHDVDDDTNATPQNKPVVYQRRKARNLGVILAVATLMALLAIAGIVYVLLQPSEDPDTLKLPEHTSKSLADEQPLPDMNTTPPVVDTPPAEMLQPQDSANPEAIIAPEPSTAVTPPAAEVLSPTTPTPNLIAPKPIPSPTSDSGHKSTNGIVAIVIDDMGVNQHNSQIMAGMNAPLTFAYLPYAPHLAQQTTTAFKQGHELIVHMPMEPEDMAHHNPGPEALLADAAPAENAARLDRNLAQMDHYIGVNNHMGSRMTANEAAMRPVMVALKDRHLWFLDSRTSANSVSAKLAAEMNVPYVARDVFLDNTQTVAAILAQLKLTEKIAARRGYAVAIGHPHDATIAAVKTWLATQKDPHIQIVPLSAIISLRFPQAALPQYAQRVTTSIKPIALTQRN